jgi:glycosyltransferase involved in cell wall biosynthesis
MEVKPILISGNQNSKEKPLLSILIPSYKRLILKDTLLSVLNQKKPLYPFEVIICENDPQAYEIEKLIYDLNPPDNFHFYKMPFNVGMTGNWNQLVKLGKGQFLCFLHDDDLLASDFLENIEKIVLDNKPIIMNSNVVFFNEMKDLDKKQYHQKFRNLSLFEVPFSSNIFTGENPYNVPTAGILIHRSIITKIGMFDERYYPYIDWEFFIRSHKHFKIYRPSFITGYYRYGHNVSLKIETLVKFCNLGHEIRKHLLTFNPFFNFYINFFILEMDYRQYKSAVNLNAQLTNHPDLLYRYKFRPFFYLIFKTFAFIQSRLSKILVKKVHL